MRKYVLLEEIHNVFSEGIFKINRIKSSKIVKKEQYERRPHIFSKEFWEWKVYTIYCTAGGWATLPKRELICRNLSVKIYPLMEGME